MKVAKYINIIDYDPNIMHAVGKLQLNVFKTGDYRTYYQEDNEQKVPHTSIDDARNHAGERGTASILDVYAIKDELHFACLAPLNDAECLAYFGTDRLTVADIERIDNSNDFWESMGRGEARYVVLFDDIGNKAQPVKYYIGGLAFG